MMLRRIIDTAFQLSITFCKKTTVVIKIKKNHLYYNFLFYPFSTSLCKPSSNFCYQR